MSVTKPARVTAVHGIAWGVPDLGRWACRSLAFAFCLGAALVLTALRLEITRLRYDLSDLHRQRQTVGADVSRLEVEAAALASPRRIEEKARELGFVYPSPDRVVVLDE